MKILIVGANGFIGSHSKNYFQKKGAEVYTAVSSESQEANSFIIDKKDPNYHDIFDKNQFDVVINAAGSKGVGFSWTNPEEDYVLNVLNNSRLLQAIVDSGQNPKVIHFSSAAVYGNPKVLPIKESFDLNPISPYGFHKLQAENLLLEYHNLYGLQTCNLRVFSVYGPQLRKQILWDVYQKVKASDNSQINLYGTGGESRDFIYIDDLLEVISVVLENGIFDGRSYNVGNGIEIKISDLVGQYLEALKLEIQPVFGGEEKKGDPIHWCADIEELKKMGYSQNVSLREGLIQVAEWIEKE